MDFGQTVKVIVFDAETTVVRYREEGKSEIVDNSPFNPKNRLVSGHWTCLEVDLEDVFSVGDAQKAEKVAHSSVFHHNEKTTPDSPDALREALQWADMIVAHNAKFDLEWLLETGFPVPPRIWDTMVGEYIFARGHAVQMGMSLDATAARRKVTLKKSDLIDDMFKKQKIGFEAMPLDTVLEYAEGDVVTTTETFLQQLDDLQQEDNIGLRPTFDLMHDMLDFLTEIERNGIAIDREALWSVGEQFQAEKVEIEKRLNELAEAVMGDTPFNLNSNADLSKILYSREVVDKDNHKKIFRIGTDARGRPLYPPRMTGTEFAGAVRATTRVIHRTVVHCCPVCKGSGQRWRLKKDGTRYKNPSKCIECDGEGVVYLPTGQKAGFRLIPEGPGDASFHGFKADKETAERLIYQAKTKQRYEAVEFLQKMLRLNAVNTYLSSFVHGIDFWTRPDGLLHAQFNQCVTATGRLSSSQPNFQNQPKGGKFPVRKAVVSRFEGGEILEADYSGLEFVTAGELSRDPQIIADILDKKDTHKQTASITNQCGIDEITKQMRQEAKPDTFAPLYGATGANKPPHIKRYYEEFFNIYRGHGAWQKLQCDSALKSGIVRVPSGREYRFENVKRFRGGRVSQQTQIVNWPVQGFATGDIVPLACVRALREFRRLGLRSLLILTVHDSVVVDVFPGERETVVAALKWAMEEISEEMKTRWNYEPVLPFRIEMESGPNWMEQSELDTSAVAANKTTTQREQAT